MLQWWEAVILGAVQGFSEFLPISSTGHLVMVERLLGIQSSGLTFDILAHVGTLLAVCIFFRKDLVRLSLLYWKQIFWATLPAVGFALLFKDWIESIREDMLIMALSYVLNAILLGVASLLLPRTEPGVKSVPEWLRKLQSMLGISAEEKVSQLQAFLVGVFQALAIVPGISRSASTVSSGLVVGLSKETAFIFAFLISIPAVFGAIVFALLEGVQSGSTASVDIFAYILAAVSSAITGYFALGLLRTLMRKNNLWLFSGYCLFVAILIVLFA